MIRCILTSPLSEEAGSLTDTDSVFTPLGEITHVVELSAVRPYPKIAGCEESRRFPKSSVFPCHHSWRSVNCGESRSAPAVSYRYSVNATSFPSDASFMPSRLETFVHIP